MDESVAPNQTKQEYRTIIGKTGECNGQEKTISNILIKYYQNIIIVVILIHPSLHSMLSKTVTKKIPKLLELLAMFSFATLGLSISNYKRKVDGMFGTSLKVLAIFTTLLSKCLLISFLALQRPSLSALPQVLTALLVFIFNEFFNNEFKSIGFEEKLTYALVASTVPVTITTIPKESKNQKADRGLKYHRKKTVGSMMSMITINLMQIFLIVGCTLFQSYLDPDYKENMTTLIKSTFGTTYSVLALICVLSYVLSCGLFTIYYGYFHPSNSYLTSYNKWGHITLLPRVSVETEDLENMSAVKDEEVDAISSTSKETQEKERAKVTKTAKRDDLTGNIFP